MDTTIIEIPESLSKKLSERIANKAHQLFFRHGIRAITMDDIAGSLSMSKKTIYRFFPDKKALVESFVEQKILMNKANYKILIDKNYDAVLELFFLLHGIKSLYLKLNPTIIRELEKNYPDAFNKFNEHKRGFICDAIKSSVKKGIREAVYQSAINIDLRCTFFLESLAILSYSENFDFRSYTNNDLAEEIFGHFLAGIATDTGVRLIARYKNKHKFKFLVTQLDPQMSESTCGQNLISLISL